jgi:hypothetical protein
VNILDENIIDSQRQRLRHWRIAIRHMGYDVGRQGMKDQEIIALLHRLRRPTFFTREEDFIRVVSVMPDIAWSTWPWQRTRWRRLYAVCSGTGSLILSQSAWGQWFESRTLIFLSGVSMPSKPSTLLGVRKCSAPGAGGNHRGVQRAGRALSLAGPNQPLERTTHPAGFFGFFDIVVGGLPLTSSAMICMQGKSEGLGLGEF